MNVVGRPIGAFTKPAVDRMRNRRCVQYWVMASVFLDILTK